MSSPSGSPTTFEKSPSTRSTSIDRAPGSRRPPRGRATPRSADRPRRSPGRAWNVTSYGRPPSATTARRSRSNPHRRAVSRERPEQDDAAEHRVGAPGERLEARPGASRGRPPCRASARPAPPPCRRPSTRAGPGRRAPRAPAAPCAARSRARPARGPPRRPPRRPGRRPRTRCPARRGSRGAAARPRRGSARISSGNQSAISRSADSSESEPWTRLKVTSRARSPRIEPGAASSGSVAPIIWRAAVTASWPSSTAATSGPRVMNSTSSPKNGFSVCSA